MYPKLQSDASVKAKAGCMPAGFLKLAELRPTVTLQDHQAKIQREAEEAASTNTPYRKLLLWQLGSGKSLGAIAAADALGGKTTYVVPASLRNNIHGELTKFQEPGPSADVLSYTGLAKQIPAVPNTLVADEAHRLRNDTTQQTRNFLDLAGKTKNLILLSGTPTINKPGDIAPLVQALTGKQMTPDEFEARYIRLKNVYPNLFRKIIGWKSGQELDVAHKDELTGLLHGHVHWHDPGKPVVPTQYEDVPVEMSQQQADLYNAMWDRLPWWAKYKLRNNVDLTDAELQRLTAFLTGPRQVGLSDYPYSKDVDPYKSFERSTKMQTAFGRLQETLKDPRAKALVFSNFIDAGLTPYAAGLARAGIPHGVFHGGLTDADRKALVDDYNQGKKRVALLGPSGTEGLSFKGTQLIQMLDPYWQPVRPKQSVGRGLRFDSHTDLPADLQNVHVERYLARLPKSTVDRMFEAVGFDRTAKTLGTDDRLAEISRRKEKLNQRFLDLLKEVGSAG